jgi:hypothetical protein
MIELPESTWRRLRCYSGRIPAGVKAMTRKPQPWWVKRTAIVNLTLVVIIGLFIVWTALR